ncbi:MAG: hypothetical protein R3C10_07010 [Pirellulales bacterium]
MTSDTTVFEIHLTLDASQADDIELARRWTAESGLKWTEIELSRGDHPQQPMITFWGQETLESQHDRAAEIQRGLASLGIRIVRVKIEVGSTEALSAAPGQYFETHVKLRLTSAENRRAVHRVAETESAHISRNARRVLDDGTEERFLTQRSYTCSGFEAAVKQQELLEAVSAAGLNVMEVESEFVIFDSNIGLDRGWEVSDV